MAEDSGQIREAITETRSEIADTMQSLGEKADVKGRLSEAVEEKTTELKSRAEALQEQARSKLPESVRPTADSAVESAHKAAQDLAGDPAKKRVVGVAAVVIALLVMARRRRKRKQS